MKKHNYPSKAQPKVKTYCWHNGRPAWKWQTQSKNSSYYLQLESNGGAAALGKIFIEN